MLDPTTGTCTIKPHPACAMVLFTRDLAATKPKPDALSVCRSEEIFFKVAIAREFSLVCTWISFTLFVFKICDVIPKKTFQKNLLIPDAGWRLENCEGCWGGHGRGRCAGVGSSTSMVRMICCPKKLFLVSMHHRVGE